MILRCTRCGTERSSSRKAAFGRMVVRVVPCPVCLKQERERGMAIQRSLDARKQKQLVNLFDELKEEIRDVYH